MRTYNLGQLHVVEHPYQDDIPAHSVSQPRSRLSCDAEIPKSILSEASLLPGSSEKERFIDAAGKRSFAFDHVDMVSPSSFNVMQMLTPSRQYLITSRTSCQRRKRLSGEWLRHQGDPGI